MADENRKSYLQERVFDKMHMSEDDVKTVLYWEDFYGGSTTKYKVEKGVDKKGNPTETPVRDADGKLVPEPIPFVKSDEHDNIDITVYTIDRECIYYDPDHISKTQQQAEHKPRVSYVVKRMHPDWVKEQEKLHPGQRVPKYKFPGGETKKGTYPFFPPRLLEAFEQKRHIETLVLTEGYFKAMKACQVGLDVVGLGSVTLFADGKTKQLYKDIVRLITTCQPDNIVILYDGDCTDVGEWAWKELENGQIADLGNRPDSFRASMLRLRELLLEFQNPQGNPCELYFAYVNKMREENPPKGLDDLLIDPEFEPMTKEIIDDLQHPGRPGVYFKKLNLRNKLTSVASTFHLQSPEAFYTEWADRIGQRKFKFHGYTYQYNPKDKKLDQLLESTLDDFVAVGNSIYFIVNEPIPGSNGVVVKFLERDKSVINARFGKGTADKLFQHKYYEGFTVNPDNNKDTYRREIVSKDGYRFYNTYYPPTVEPEMGPWPTIEKLLRHVTKKYCDSEQQDAYEMLLDYFAIAKNDPTQFLPILILVSPERGTGKTSILNLIRWMYGNNSVIGGNDLIASKFNSSLRGKEFVCVDESCLGENREVGEALKYMSTTRTIQIEGKGKDKEEYINFAKFVLCSNEVKKAVFVGKDEIRYWVLRVLPWTDEELDVEADEKMENEIPHFLHYLDERYCNKKLFVQEKEHRMWFHPNRLRNEDLEELMKGGESNFESSLYDWLRNMFIDCNRIKLEFDVDYIQRNVPDAKKKDANYIRNLLREMRGVTLQESHKVAMPFRVTQEMMDEASRQGTPLDEDEGEIIWPSRKKQCRPYQFDALYFLDPSEYEELAKKAPQTPKEEKEERKSVVAATKNQQTTLPITPGVNADGKWPTLDANGNPISGADESAADGNSLGDDKGQPF